MGCRWWGWGQRRIGPALLAIGFGSALGLVACGNGRLGDRGGTDAAPAPATVDAAANGGQITSSRDAGDGDRAAGADGGGGADAGWPPVCPAAATPPTSSVDSVGTCGATLSFGDALSVAPAVAGQAYLRCGTVGSETTWQVTLSADASRLAALTSSGTIRLFATDDWREIAQLASPIGQLDAAAFSPDGKTLAAVSRELGAVTLWRTDGGQLIRSIAVPARTTIGGASSALAFSSDGRLLVTSLEAIIDLATDTVTDWSGNPIVPSSSPPADIDVARDDGNLIFPSQLRFVGCDSRVLLAASFPAGNAGFARGVNFFDPRGGPVALGGNLYAGIAGVAASNDGRWVAYASYGGDPPAPFTLGLFNAASGALYASDGSATGTVVGFSPDGSELYMDLTSEIDVRAVPTLAILRRLPMPLGGALVAVSPLGPLIVSTPTSSLWLDPATGAVLRHAAFPISAPSFSADGRYGVASGGGALFHLWHEADAASLCAPVAPPAGAAVATMALSPDGQTLGIERADGAVELRPVAQNGQVGALQATVTTGFAPPYSATMRLANGGARMAVEGTPDAVDATDVPSSPSNVGVFDQTGELLIAPAISASGPLYLALSPDGKELAYVTGDPSSRQLAVASVDSNTVIFAAPLAPPLEGVDSFSADGTRMALPANDGMEIWRLADGQEESVVGNGGLAGPSTFSPGWTYLAEPTFPQSGSGASYVPPYLSIWNPTTGAELARIDPLDLDAPARVDDTGTIAVGDELVTHTLDSDWYALFVYDLPGATERRMFQTTSSAGEPVLTFAGGTRILTRLGSALALWCR